MSVRSFRSYDRHMRLKIRQEQSFTDRAMQLLFGEDIFRLSRNIKYHDFTWTIQLKNEYLEIMLGMEDEVFSDDACLRKLICNINSKSMEARLLVCSACINEDVVDDVNFHLFYKDDYDYLRKHRHRVYRLEGLRTWRYVVIIATGFERGWRYYYVDDKFQVASKVWRVPCLRRAVMRVLAGFRCEPIEVNEISCAMSLNRYW